MNKSNQILLALTLCILVFALAMPAQAEPASWTDSNRRLAEACVDPQINGNTVTRKKDGEPKTHTLTFQFSADYRQASVIAGSRVAKTTTCTAVFNLVTGRITGTVNIDGEVFDYALQFTSGLSFSVLDFPLPMVAEGEQTSLWRVTNGTNEVIVGGVVNGSQVDFWSEAFGFDGVDILRPSDFPLPAGFEEAYDNADVILTLADPAEFGRSLLTLNGLVVSPLTNIGNSLDEDTHAELETYMQDLIQLNVNNLGAFRPHWMADLVRFMSAYVAGFVPGVETYFQAKAVQDGKVNWGLEPADDLMFAMNLNKLNEDPNAQISAALAEVKSENFVASLNALLDAWRTGDDDFLDDALVEPDRQGDLAAFKRFYTDRYAIWLPVFDNMLQSAQQEFVLMDVRYLVGVDSFLRQLEDAGYTVTRY